MSDKNVSAQKTEREIRVEKIINETTMSLLKTELLATPMYKNDSLAVLRFQGNHVDQLLVLLSPEAKKICLDTHAIIKRAVEYSVHRTMVEFPSLN